MPRVGLPLGDLATRIVHIAEDNSLGRTDRLAGRYHVAVADGPILDLRRHLARANSLHAVSTLLHYATAADGHFRIAAELQTLGRIIRILQEIEAPDLVRTVVRAIACADATVIDHVIEPV